MKRFYLFVLTSMLSAYCHSQISFDKGYFINNLNEKIDCYIKNVDWKNNPKEFEYIIQENGEPKIKTITYIKEFGIFGKSKYGRYIVDIDRSSKKLDKLSTNRNPVFKEEELFLKILIEGKANLFSYDDGSLRRFFYSVDDSEVRQLVFKNFKTPENKVGENNKYKQQLLMNLICKSISESDFKLINYSESELTDIFVKYNECSNSDYINYNQKNTSKAFNLSIRPGFNMAALTIDNHEQYGNHRDIEFGTKAGFRLGLEAEFIMQFNRNKWAVIIEPTYQYYEAEKETERVKVKADYKSIELPVGIRHYMFLKDAKSKLFIDAAFVLDFSMNSIIDFESRGDLKLISSPNLALGFGCKFNDKFSVELRYLTSRDVLQSQLAYDSYYNSISAIIGYSIF